MALTTVVVALGSNLGDRRGHLLWAVERLRERFGDLRVSTIVESEPEGVEDVQPPYLNAVVVGSTDQPATEVLDELLTLERTRGRIRTGTRSARTLDLDLILYGDAVVDSPTLRLPHPRFRERWFVLAPLAAVAPELCDPVTGRTMRDLLGALGESTGA